MAEELPPHARPGRSPGAAEGVRLRQVQGQHLESRIKQGSQDPPKMDEGFAEEYPADAAGPLTELGFSLCSNLRGLLSYRQHKIHLPANQGSDVLGGFAAVDN